MNKRFFDFSYLIKQHSDSEFEKIALELFHYQYRYNNVYKEWCNLLNVDILAVKNINQIPFLPISAFKYHKIIANELDEQLVFQSSGTSQQQKSKHYIAYSDLYNFTLIKNFEFFYGSVKGYNILALLPSYIENGDSSLVYMCQKLMEYAGCEKKFYLYDHQALYNELLICKKNKTRTILIGVSYALLDFIENFQMFFPELIVMETGGMKGRKKEIIRKELHERLKTAFDVKQIHSEYGMTELLSQAYSIEEGKFFTPPWMKIFIRNSTNPLELEYNNLSGGINVIDLANAYSCPFIATEDLGKIHPDNSFEVLGRFDYAAVRGCNTMIT